MRLFLLFIITMVIVPSINAQQNTLFSPQTSLEELSWRRAYFYRQTLEVREAFRPEMVSKRFNYCLESQDPNLLTCGSLVYFLDNNGFMYNFSSLERQVGATEYFIPNSDGSYRAYLDDLFDGQVYIDHVYKENSRLRISFNEGFPLIPQIRLKLHGTSKYGVVSFNFSMKALEIQGFLFDENDPDFKKAVNLTYQRVN